jgi:hypothetical protein
MEMKFNLILVLSTALIPLVIGFIWYNPKVFGNIWMKEVGLKMEDGQNVNLTKLLLMSLVYSIMTLFILTPIVIHQFGIFSTLATQDAFVPNSENAKLFSSLIEKYGTNFRTLKHGALHGFLTGVFLVLPIVGTSSLYENRSWKYVLISSGFWIVNFMIMGAIICAYA